MPFVPAADTLSAWTEDSHTHNCGKVPQSLPGRMAVIQPLLTESTSTRRQREAAAARWLTHSLGSLAFSQLAFSQACPNAHMRLCMSSEL